MVEVELDEELSIEIEPGVERLYRLSVIYDETEIVSYEAATDLRTIAGRIILRNVINRHLPEYEKAELETLLEAELERNDAAITRTLERR